MSETNRIEYKEKPTTNLEKEVVAFLNYKGGGRIFIGVDDSGMVKGITLADQLQLQIKDRLKNNILPSCLGLFDVVIEEREQKQIIMLIVAGGQERPYYIKKYGLSEKGAFIRRGSAAEPMTTTMIEKLFAKRTRHSISKIKSPFSELKFEQLRIYYDTAGKTLNHQFAKSLELRNDDEYNFVGYLMADNNNLSVKVAKYAGKGRIDLIENEEYGFCSLIKATKQVLDKVELENRTLTKITSRERKEKRLWNAVALREAVINALVHNDYTYELAPKFEFFNDRLEITSYGGLPDGITREEFFDGISFPRSKELMRIFRDMELVEQLGSGLPRILQAYSKNCFTFSENYIRMSFPAEEQVTEQVTAQVTEQVTEQVKDLIKEMKEGKEYSRSELMKLLGLAHREYFRKSYLQKAIELNSVERTIPDKPRSRNQKYKLTNLGGQLKNELAN